MLRTILRAIRPLGEEADHPRLLGVNAKAVSQRRNRVIERKRKSHRLVLSVVTSVLADKGNIGRMGRNVNRYRQKKGGRSLLVLTPARLSTSSRPATGPVSTGEHPP